MASGIRVTGVLARSLRIWVRGFVPFTIAIALTYAPLLLFLAAPEPRRTCAGMDDLLLLFGPLFAACLLWAATPAAVAHGVLRQLRGEPADLLGCLRTYAKRLLPVLLTGLAIGSIGVPCAFACGFVTGALGASVHLEDLSPVIALPLAGALTACFCWVAVPVAAAEKVGGMVSLQRSIRLTRGARGTIFLIALATIAIQILPLVLLGGVLGPGPLGIAAMFLAAVVLATPGAVATVVGYHDLRTAKEGTAELAGVFA